MSAGSFRFGGRRPNCCGASCGRRRWTSLCGGRGGGGFSFRSRYTPCMCGSRRIGDGCGTFVCCIRQTCSGTSLASYGTAYGFWGVTRVSRTICFGGWCGTGVRTIRRLCRLGCRSFRLNAAVRLNFRQTFVRKRQSLPEKIQKAALP